MGTIEQQQRNRENDMKNPAAKMVVDQYRRRYSDAHMFLTSDVREALVDSIILGICLGQASNLEWSNVKRHTQEIRDEVMIELGFWEAE